jgi:hypothetical protein
MAAAAGIGAAGSILGGILSGKGAKAAAKTQRQAVDDQIAASNANRDYQYNLNAPTINATNGAAGDINSFLSGDQSGLDKFRANTGYQDLLKTGLDSVNANAYARGGGDSGAAYKALMTKGTAIADQSAGGYLGNLQNLAALGGQARGLVAGIGTGTVTANNAATQNGADATSNASLINSSNWSKILAQLGAQGAQAVSGTGSSFAPITYTPPAGGNNDLSWLDQPLSPQTPQLYGI